MRSRVLAIVVAVVVPLAALGVVIAQRGDSTHKPARLPILASGGAENATLGAARADAALYPYGGIVYKAGPNLPTLEGSARAYTVAAPDAAAVRRLADAFGFGGIAPDATTTFTNGDAQLTVSPLGYWGYTRQSNGGVVASSGVAVACAPDAADCPVPPTTAPQHPADLPSQETAKATALEVLQRAGVDTVDATITIDDFVTQWSVRVDPVVDGLPTEGLSTTLAVGERSLVEYANGILGRSAPADEYPLIGTRAAIEKLNNGEIYYGGGPRPMIAEDTAGASASGGAGVAGAEPPSAGSPGADPGSAGPTEPLPLPPCDGVGAPTTFPCGPEPVQPPVTDTIPPPPPPQEITLTGAELVLTFASSYDGTQSWLVPAYRFSTSDGVGPTVLAIDDSFIAPPPDQVPTGKGSVDSGGSVTIEPAPSSDPAAKEPSTGG